MGRQTHARHANLRVQSDDDGNVIVKVSGNDVLVVDPADAREYADAISTGVRQAVEALAATEVQRRERVAAEETSRLGEVAADWRGSPGWYLALSYLLRWREAGKSADVGRSGRTVYVSVDSQADRPVVVISEDGLSSREAEVPGGDRQ